MTTDTEHRDESAAGWTPHFTAAGAMAVTLLAAALAIAWLITEDLGALPPFGDLIWHARLLFANFLIIVLSLMVAAAWLLIKNARELHELRSRLNAGDR
ncbi:MAG: hypothetical protein ABSD74_07885 [Rhizomicrobium sp.]|jgi:hypothetical protein